LSKNLLEDEVFMSVIKVENLTVQYAGEEKNAL